MTDENARILLIDDDVELTAMMQQFLNVHGYAAKALHNGAEGLAEALTGNYELVLLDVMMPGLDGFEVLRRLREQSRLAVLMLTAQGEPRSRIQGLDAGADDYLAKPFEPLELLARVRAILRRTHATPADGAQAVEIAGVRLDPGARSVRSRGRTVEITSSEFDILEILMRAAGRVVSRDQLTQKLYGRDSSPYDRSIDVHVSHLRRKLEQGDDRIRTVRGVGYQFATEEL